MSPAAPITNKYASASMSWTYNDPFGNRAAQNVGHALHSKPRGHTFNPANNLMTADNFTSAPLLDAQVGQLRRHQQLPLRRRRADMRGRDIRRRDSILDATGQRVMKGSIGTFNCNISSKSMVADQ